MSTEASLPTESAGDESDGGGLRRSIGGGLLLMFILGDVLGAGIYALVGEIAAESGGAVWVPLLVALGLALLTGFSYAELVTKYPQAGGAAVFAQRAYGRPWMSFLVGFAMLAAGVTSAAALSLAFAGDYLAQFADLPQTPVALGFLVLVALLNARGIKDSLRANLVMTLIELSGLVLVVVLAVAVLGAGDGDPGQALEFKEGVNPGSAVLAASVLAFYSFVGFETSANVAEETRDPRRAYPRALLGGLVIAGIIYCAIGLAVSTALPLDELTSGENPLLAVVEASPIQVPSKVFAAIALVAVANGALLTMIMASRLTYGMARDGLLPSALGTVLPGLIDAHCHAYGIGLNMLEIESRPLSYVALVAARRLAAALARGFTTVRDPSGGDAGSRGTTKRQTRSPSRSSGRATAATSATPGSPMTSPSSSTALML